MQALMMTAVNGMGNIDVIFNSAGAQRSGPVTDFEKAERDWLLALFTPLVRSDSGSISRCCRHLLLAAYNKPPSITSSLPVI